MVKIAETDVFWSRVDKRGPDECWPWMGGVTGSGYGGFRGRSVHRVAALSKGPAYGRYVLHSCDNKLCCNPAHLRYGTPQDNVDDAKARGRHKNPPPSKVGRKTSYKGEKMVNSTLTEEIVRRVWELHFQGLDCGTIAKMVGQTHSVAYDICRGRSWRYLDGAPSLEDLKKGGVRRGFNQSSYPH